MRWLKQDMIQYPVPHCTPEEDKSQIKTHTHTNAIPSTQESRALMYKE